MSSFELHRDHDERPFFRSPVTYVLVFASESGQLCIATERASPGRVILCFLSLIDALIEVAHFARLGKTYRPMLASHVDKALFCDEDGRGVIAKLHIAWPACDGRIMLRPKGQLGRYERTLHYWATVPATFELDGETFDVFDRIHERAGLFAWCETVEESGNWSERRQQLAVEWAIGSMPVTHADPSAWNQLALFDPEFGQWHFVPRAAAD